MNLTGYVEALRQQLAVAAAAGGDEAQALAERLTAPLDPDDLSPLLGPAAPVAPAAPAPPAPHPQVGNVALPTPGCGQCGIAYMVSVPRGR